MVKKAKKLVLSIEKHDPRQTTTQAYIKEYNSNLKDTIYYKTSPKGETTIEVKYCKVEF